MNRLMLCAVFVAVTSAAMAAHVTGGMRTDDHAGRTASRDTVAADKTYVGCIQPGSTLATFVLVGADEVTRSGVRHDASQDGMRHDAMMTGRDAMTTSRDTMSHDTMSHDAMMATTLALTTKTVDLRKHVGQRVLVTGKPGAPSDAAMDMAPSFAVKKLKMVAKSCSPAK